MNRGEELKQIISDLKSFHKVNTKIAINKEQLQYFEGELFGWEERNKEILNRINEELKVCSNMHTEQILKNLKGEFEK